MKKDEKDDSKKEAVVLAPGKEPKMKIKPPPAPVEDDQDDLIVRGAPKSDEKPKPGEERVARRIPWYGSVRPRAEDGD